MNAVPFLLISHPFHPTKLIRLFTIYVKLDYWNLHSLDLLDALPEPAILIDSLILWNNCNSAGTNFPLQEVQMGNNLSLEVMEEVLDKWHIVAQNTLMKIRSRLHRFFFTLRTPLNIDDANSNNNPVGFSLHLDGESDVRGTYTVIAISRILHILTPELVQNVPEYVIACQTYEGGFGGEPMGTEAHGGYTFCAVAALSILNKLEKNKLEKVRDIPNLQGWLARRQMEYEGGYSGRW